MKVSRRCWLIQCYDWKNYELFYFGVSRQGFCFVVVCYSFYVRVFFSVEFEWDYRGEEEGNFYGVKEDVKIILYLMLVQVFEYVFVVMVWKCKGRQLGDVFQSIFYGEEIKKFIK